VLPLGAGPVSLFPLLPGPASDSVVALFATRYGGLEYATAAGTVGNVPLPPAGITGQAVVIADDAVHAPVSVDGGAASAQQTISGPPGQRHTVSVTVPPTSSGVRKTVSWSDGSTQPAHTISLNSFPLTDVAAIITAYQVTMAASPAAGGSVSVDVQSPDGFYQAGVTLNLTATPNPGYMFTGWSGPLTGTANPAPLVLAGPGTITANFAASISVTIQTSPSGMQVSVDGGAAQNAPQVYQWTPGSSHSISALSSQPANGTWYKFANWGDGGAQTHSITVPAAAATYTASFSLSPIDDNSFFVNQLYLDLLGRPADPAGLSYWLGQLTSGAATRSQLAYSFFASLEFQGNGMFIISAYIAVLGRNADYTGWLYWLGNLQAGLAQQQVINAFIQSTEFQTTYGSLNNTAFVTLVYQNVLARPPDASGLSYWLGQLNSGAATRAQCMYSFATSTEFQTRIQNQALATLLYLGFLRRSPDPTGVTYWTGQLNAGLTPATVLSAFITSPEYIARF